jgi:hypothetical protein
MEGRDGKLASVENAGLKIRREKAAWKARPTQEHNN